MKKISEYAVRGQLSENDSESLGGFRINLFDGRYDTGYKVTRFDIWGSTYSNGSGPDVIGKLGTEQNLNTGPTGFFNAQDQREIAWAGGSGGLDTLQMSFVGIVDRENLIIEDLYVYVRGLTDTVDVNYYIEFDKYELEPFRGPLAMIENKSQG